MEEKRRDEDKLLILPADELNSAPNSEDIDMSETENMSLTVEPNAVALVTETQINRSEANEGINVIKIQVDDSGYVEANVLPKKDETLSSDLSENKNDENSNMNQMLVDLNAEASTSNPNAEESPHKIPKKRNYRLRAMRTSSTSSSSFLDSDDTNTPPEEQDNDSVLPEDTDTELVFSPIESNFYRNSDDEDQDNDDPNSENHDDGNSDTLSSEYMHSYSDSEEEDENDLSVVENVLVKEKPKYKMNIVYELMCRENGLSSFNHFRSQSNRGPLVFQNRVNSSRNIIEKMKFLHSLEKHRGCVNSLNYNRAGTLLCTGSDDLKIILWNWALKKVKYSFQSGHQSNVFQTKFIELPSGGLNIVSSARDGLVRHAIIPPSGGEKVVSTILCKHVGAVHKIAICPSSNFEILTAGEDGEVFRCDLRDKPVEKLVSVKVDDKHKMALYSIAHHPLDPEFCVCGRDQFVRVYDKRNPKTPVCKMYPEHLFEKNRFITHITCAVYSNYGNEILASYSNESIYLFNNKCYLPGHFTQTYQGHNNNKTIKGVNFFGSNSEYVISGSDCGNIFFWDKVTGSILNWLDADRQGIVNCLEPHPSFPILATSGLDHDAKIWAPLSDSYPPNLEGLEKCVKSNIKATKSNDQKLFDDRTFLFFVRKFMRTRNRITATFTDNCPTVRELETSSDDEDSEDRGARTMPCTTQ